MDLMKENPWEKVSVVHVPTADIDESFTHRCSVDPGLSMCDGHEKTTMSYDLSGHNIEVEKHGFDTVVSDRALSCHKSGCVQSCFALQGGTDRLMTRAPAPPE